MPDRQAQTADGVIHSFPDGTPDAVIDKAIKEYTAGQNDELTKKTQAAAPKTSTRPYFEKPPVGTPFPSTNPIEAQGKRLDLLGQRQEFARRSVTPFSDASVLLSPVSAARQIVESRVGGYAGKKLAPSLGVDPETAEALGGLVFPAAAETAGAVMSMPTPKVSLKNKFSLGPVEIERNIPPPPEPPIEEVAAKRATEKIAQRRADEAAGLRRPQSEVEAERTAKQTKAAAKEREAAFNKDAQERMAIQKRADDAEAARVQAEKEAKNARFKAEQEHAKELAAAEKARQDEITAQAKLKQVQEQMAEANRAKESARLKLLQQQEKAAIKEANDAAAQKERLRDQHAQALQRRGREQAALDKAAQKANEEEGVAKEEVKKAPAAAGGGRRPTSSEQYLTGLVKKNILSPDEFNTLRSELGEDAVPKRGESNAAWRARVMGLIRSSRAARGMADVSSGPSAAAKPVTTGGSGESGASAEAINRTAAEKRGGVKYFIEDTRTKSRVPVSSVDVNSGLRVGPGKRIIRSSPEGEFEF